MSALVRSTLASVAVLVLATSVAFAGGASGGGGGHGNKYGNDHKNRTNNCTDQYVFVYAPDYYATAYDLNGNEYVCAKELNSGFFFTDDISGRDD
ncbi:MAG TPA: hypothetical protein VEX41_08240 [Candidatus Eisenbacteria bacterium]|nr:hypothetical protein [Candidatus Eisenbacteria bacterium]